ncbi:MAG: hypothetical protein DI598_03480 [Pseudopedobacter saltans]|uniref:peptidylprolyl isomerase n=1 Tax=Pseudopedobacter saltans TaxID=151895 RepID=A0A2W5GZU5_9SPHI|nr:MAG: hypothetical protein DI598_03480 [Pseudopedobacter saltans]
MRQLLSGCVVAIAVLFCSCQGNYKKTKDGLEYKIFAGKDQKDSTFKAGDFVKFNIEYSIKRKGKKDTLIYSTYGEMPQFGRVDTASHNDMNFTELFPLMRVGDSAEFKVNVDTLIKRNLIQENPMFPKGSLIVGKMSVIEKFKTEAEVYPAIAKEVGLEKGREMATVQKYLKDKNLTAQMTKDSVFVVLENAGDQAAKADSGLQVSVKYKGTLMKTDSIFDTNMDKSKGHDQPMDIVLGQHMVIPGWESGLKMFGKGGKGKIIVPAFMGYGPQGGGGAIPPNANLVFDVEVLDVRKPDPKAAQAPAGGQQIDPETLKKLQEQMKAQQAQKGEGAKTAAPATPK